MAKILINALSAQLGGGQTHLLNVFKNHDNVWSDSELIFLTSESNSQVFEKEFGKERVINIGPVGNSFFQRGIWENFKLSRMASDMKVDIVFLAAGIAPFWMTKKCKWVAISHNLLPYGWKSIIQSKGLGLKLKLLIIRYAQIWSFRHTTGVIFTSIHASKVIKSFIKKDIKDVVIPSGINSIFFEKKNTIFDVPYLLYVSTFFEYKHQKEVLIAFRKFLDQGNKGIKLIFIGNNSGLYGDECKKLCHDLGLNDSVIFKGNIPYAELPGIMQHALLNIFASDCENCPNILLEYLASGTPILCSNYEPMPEFGRKFVTYFDPTDPEDLAKKLVAMFPNRAPMSQELLSEVKGLYSWKLAAAEIKKFFNTL